MDRHELLYTDRITRLITGRTIIQATLELLSPTLISSGDSDLPTDMVVLRDAAEGKALVPGSSIAGALRAYLAQFNQSEARQHFLDQLSPELRRYLSDNHKNLITGEEQVFGAAMKSDDSDGDQSAILISDAFSNEDFTLEIRDGVKIEPTTRTASDNAKYDLELVPAGTTFTLRFELIEEVPFGAEKQPLWADVEAYNTEQRRLFAQALSGLENGSIALGMRKQRGLGECQVTHWQVWHFDLTKPSHMLDWLRFDGTHPHQHGKQISQLLKCDSATLTNDCVMIATFRFDQSLLIRSSSDAPYTPDDVFLTTTRNKQQVPVIPGTSWAGVIRHRAEKIVNTLGKHASLVTALFGFVAEDENTAKRSRVRISDSIIEHASTDYVQTRIAIDRFTGGVYPSALLVEQPVWGTKESTIELILRLSPPQQKDDGADQQFSKEIGLLLLVIKDLWLGDLPIGGEQSIGRGTLRGTTLELRWNGKTSTITQNPDELRLSINDQHGLQAFVDALNEVKQ